MTDEEFRATFRLCIKGRVQGVGFRYWLIGEARRQGVDGWVRNRKDGFVEALVSGPPLVVHSLIELCWQGPPSARVSSIEQDQAKPPEEKGFHALPTL